MTPKHKNSDADSLDLPKKGHEVFPSEKVKIQYFERQHSHNISL